MRIAVLIVIIISTLVVFLRNDVIFSNFQPRLETRKINSGRKFSEIKVRKTWVIMFVIDWNLQRYAGKTYCVQKCKKMGIENLIIVALKRRWSLQKTYFFVNANKTLALSLAIHWWNSSPKKPKIRTSLPPFWTVLSSQAAFPWRHSAREILSKWLPASP